MFIKLNYTLLFNKQKLTQLIRVITNCIQLAIKSEAIIAYLIIWKNTFKCLLQDK